MPTSTPVVVPLSELASFMRDASLAEGDEAEKLQEHLDAATEYVQSVVGPVGEVAVRWDVYAGDTTRQLVLPATHVQEIISITAPDGSDVTVDARRDVNALAGIVTVPKAMRGTWTVEGRPREAVPSIKLAIKIIASHLWGTQRGTGGGRGAMYARGDDTPATPAGFAIPRRAEQLLAPYRIPHEFA